MRTLQLWLKAIRWHFCLVAGIGTWVTALVSNGPQWCSPPKVASALTMGFCVAGSSLYHYGAAREIYARKSERWWVTQTPRWSLMLFGISAFIVAVFIAKAFLNLVCASIVIFDAVVIILYAKYLGRHWLTKNLAIAVVITSPVFLGWFAGHRMNPAVPWLIAAIGMAYLAREIIKDVDDVLANQGRRVTLPMALGQIGAMRVAGLCSIISTGLLIFAAQYLLITALLVASVYVIALVTNTWVTLQLFRDHQPGKIQHWIFGMSLLLILDMFLYRVQHGL